MPRPPRSNPKTRTRAIELRKELTPAERKLWARIRNDQLGVNFRRQHAIGNFIPDFVCIEKKLIIELDGSQHLEQEEYDEERTKYFKSLGYKVIRFWGVSNIKHIPCHVTLSDSEGSLRLSARFFAAKNKSAAQNDIRVFLLSSILDTPRFWNNDVTKGMDGVIRAIVFVLDRA